MKKFKIITLLLLIVIFATCFCACEDKITLPDNIEVIDIPDNSYENAGEMLIALSELSTIELIYSTSEYGMYITKISGNKVTLEQNADTSTYISYYISSDNAEYIDPTADPIIYNDTSYYSAGLGVSAMPILDNVSYLFCTVTYGQDFSSTVNEDYLIFE